MIEIYGLLLWIRSWPENTARWFSFF